MPIIDAIRQGLRRVSANPQLLALLWLINFAMAIPLTMVMSDQIEASIGASLIHEKLRAGLDIDWYEEFAYTADDLGKTFSPAMISVGPFLSNVEAWLNGSLLLTPYAGIAGLGIAYMVVWAFLLGGIFDRFAHGEVSWTMERFFSASGRYFLRFLLLMVFSWIFYLLVLSMISPGLFGIIANATGDTTAERPVFFLTAGIYLVVALLLGFVNMVFDYAKITTVVNDHRNMLAAAWQGFRFVRSQPSKTFGLYITLAIVALLFLGVYSLIAPGAASASGFAIVLAFLVGQVYLIVKLITRLALLGGQMAFYEAAAGATVIPAMKT